MSKKIFVKSLQNKVLTFTVDTYSIEDGYISFLDKKTGKRKRFPIFNTEIEECDE